MVSIDAWLSSKKSGMFLWCKYRKPKSMNIYLYHMRFQLNQLVRQKYIQYVIYAVKNATSKSIYTPGIFPTYGVKKVSPKIFVVSTGYITISPPTSVSPSSV